MRTIRLVFREVDRDKFDQIADGRKSIETRAATSKYRNSSVGDQLVIVCGHDTQTKAIQAVTYFDSLEALFAVLPLKHVLPSVSTLEEAKAVYCSFPNYREKIAEHGIVALMLGPEKIVDSQ